MYLNYPYEKIVKILDLLFGFRLLCKCPKAHDP
jgi:hypothetical protein